MTAATNRFYTIQDIQDTAQLQQNRNFDINDSGWAGPTSTLGRNNLPTETSLTAPLDVGAPDFNFGEIYEMLNSAVVAPQDLAPSVLSLNTSESATLGHDNLPVEIAPPDGSILDSNFDEMLRGVLNPAAVQPQDFAHFGLSPNTSESCTSEWTTESTSSPLFPTPGSGILTNDFTAFGAPSPPLVPPPPSSCTIKTKADVDAYVERLVTRRRRRDTAPKLKCPFEGCDPERIHRRPAELKARTYVRSHRRISVRVHTSWLYILLRRQIESHPTS
ncbi:hypothetical protein FRC06_011047 [Ceratobasidium sp. 370]|nr:hypothetical protein FRC06_011047 [Ceratobasidium sp. 370]